MDAKTATVLFDGELATRAQAKRVAARFENVNEVELDFSSVDNVGRAFADELVRVWPLAHPSVKIKIINPNELVAKMLTHVTSRSDLPQPTNAVEIIYSAARLGSDRTESIPVEIISKAARVLGTQLAAMRWLAEPAMGLDQRSPIDVMMTPDGVKQVDDLLTRMEFGTYS